VLSGAVLLLISAFFTLSLLAVPALPHLRGLGAEVRRAVRPALPPRPARERLLAARERKILMREIAKDVRAHTSRAKPAPAVVPAAPTSVLTGAFYAPWQESGIYSLRANADRLTHLFPVWLRLDPGGSGLDTRDWDPGLTPRNVDVLQICREHHIEVHPVLSNAHEGVFDSARAHMLLSDPARQEQLARQVHDWIASHGFRGLNVDLENLEPGDPGRLPAFLSRLHRALAADSLVLSFDLQAEGDAPPAGAVARACDFVVLMGYDQHGRYDPPGALCGARWFEDALDRTLQAIPPEKLVCGIGAYGYDWTERKPPADALTCQQAMSTASDERPDDRPEDVVDFDPHELNATFEYRDDAGHSHEVWVLDAISAANERTLALARGVQSTVVWVLGSEDPDLWSFVDRAHPDAKPDSAHLAATHYPFDVDFSGDGELLGVQSYPTDGSRTLEQDRATGLFTDENYHRYASPFVLSRQGYQPKAIALTFDDGPAWPWTGEILDELARDSVEATFFVVGRNAERHPDLLRRIYDEGHEIGNHTFTHPNLAAVSPQRAELELNATQRVIEAELGHSTVLFRPPYNADAEPASAEEVTPILRAAQLGYVTVGETLDPEDWQLAAEDSAESSRSRTGQDIANAVLKQVHSLRGNAVLLHDGGGDRSRTVEALRIVVPVLKREGYRFVTVSALGGLERDQVMPALSPRDRALRGVDRATFESAFLVESFLYWAFLTAIALGAARVLWVTTLALLSTARRRPLPDPPGLSVSVMIAAYNEGKVIARTLHAVLEGDVAPVEVIVVDDGSTDATAEEVARVAAADPRVRLLRQVNAGKAAAMNRALMDAHGDVLVCLDADTVIAADAIGLLLRHFADPAVGAAAGNVKVGNHVNLWTRWQSIEYIVSQNLDRRAHSLLNSIPVVPGAIGAWRREAVVAAGGYLSDTLAEDMDLTWRLRRAGWRIANESEALGYTEVPETLWALLRQRFRWTYGTLQCLWKHRDALGHYGWFGRVTLPSLWLFQIAYQVLSPLVDLQVILTFVGVGAAYLSGAIVTREWQPLPQAVEACAGIVTLFVFFFLLELLGAIVAYRLDRERWRDLLWLFWQRFVYRQVMYAVAVQSIARAIVGRRAGWGKLERRGSARAAA
jgi:poly-beta-1,6 N-acetyl-D-glucosamine synthase